MRIFELTTLGRVSLTGPDGKPVATLLAQPKRLGMLAYLAVAGAHGVVRRDLLCELFWPDVPVDRARTSLRQALAFLRRALGDDAVVTRGADEVGVDATLLRCDAAVLRRHLLIRDHDPSTVLALYTGEFMPAVAVGDVPRFDRWLEDVRSDFSRAAGEAAITLARASLANGDGDAVVWAKRAREVTPFDERAVGVLMEALDAAGDRGGALRSYDAFVRQLHDALDVEPEPETVAVMQAIRMRDERDPSTQRPPDYDVSPRAAIDRAPVLRLPPALPEPPGAEPASAPSAKPIVTAAPMPRDAWRHTWRWAAVAAGVVVAAAWFTQTRPRKAPDPATVAARTLLASAGERVLVASFVNETGDPTLDPLGRMTADWITEGISRIGGLAVAPGTTLLTMDRARRAGDSTVPVQLDAMARETGATMVVSGSYYLTGSTLHLQARLTDASLSRLLRPMETVSVPSDSVASGVAMIRERVLATMALLLDSTTHFRFAGTPPSFEAYRDFLRGFDEFVDGELATALTFFDRAAQADTTYRMAQLAAAIAQSNLGDTRGAFARVRDLKRTRDRLGPVEQGTLDMIDGLLRGDIPAVYAAVARTSRITPGSIVEYMVAESARRLNRPVEALRVLRGLHPDRGELRGWRAFWREWGYALHMTGDYAGELAMVREARVRYPGSSDLLAAEVRALAALGQVDAVEELLRAVDMLPGALRAQVGAMYRLASAELLVRGDSTGASACAQRAIVWYELPENARRIAGYVRALRLAGQYEAAWRAVLPLGDTVSAGTSSLVDLGISNADDVRVLMRDMGVLAAHRGDTALASQWERRIAQQQASLEESLRGRDWAGLQFDRAAIAAQRGELEHAIALLREALNRGLAYWPGLTADMDLAPLRDHPAFQAMMRPAG